jgi:ribosome-associated translation inhibitor RaiA
MAYQLSVLDPGIGKLLESDHIAATEKGEQLQSTLDGALDAVERQVHKRRKQQRNY